MTIHEGATEPKVETLPVIFRKSKDEGGTEIVAVFPTMLGGYKYMDMMCYAHIGQHSGCSLQWYWKTKPARYPEYSDLLAELKQIYENDEDEPVKLRVYQRIHPWMRDELRKQQLQDAADHLYPKE